MVAAANASQQQTYGLNQELAPPAPPAIIALPRHPETRMTMLQQHHQEEDDGSHDIAGFFAAGHKKLIFLCCLFRGRVHKHEAVGRYPVQSKSQADTGHL